MVKIKQANEFKTEMRKTAGLSTSTFAKLTRNDISLRFVCI